MNVYTTGVTRRVTPDIQLSENDFYQLIYCSQEGGRIFVGGKWHKAVRGDMYFATPTEKFAIEQHGNLNTVEINFIVDTEKVQSLLQKVPRVFSLNDDKRLLGIFRVVVSEALGGEVYNGESTDAAILLFLVKLIRKFVLSDETPRDLELKTMGVTTLEHRCDEPMKKIIWYIEQHLSEPITLDDLSEYVYMNKLYFSKRFKDIWGVTPKRYINMMRIERAKKLLITTELSVSDIAKNTGYASVYYFSRFFKQKENISPRRFREQYKDR